MAATSRSTPVFIEKPPCMEGPSYDIYKKKKSLLLTALSSLGVSLISFNHLPREVKIAQKVFLTSFGIGIGMTFVKRVFPPAHFIQTSSFCVSALTFIGLAYLAANTFALSVDRSFSEAEHLTDNERLSSTTSALKQSIRGTFTLEQNSIKPIAGVFYGAVIASVASMIATNNKMILAPVLLSALGSFAYLANSAAKIFAVQLQKNLSEKRQEMFEKMYPDANGRVTIGPHSDAWGRSLLRPERQRPDPDKIDKTVEELEHEIEYLKICEIGFKHGTPKAASAKTRIRTLEAHLNHLLKDHAKVVMNWGFYLDDLKLIQDPQYRLPAEMAFAQMRAAISDNEADRASYLQELTELKTAYRLLPPARAEVAPEERKDGSK